MHANATLVWIYSVVFDSYLDMNVCNIKRKAENLNRPRLHAFTLIVAKHKWNLKFSNVKLFALQVQWKCQIDQIETRGKSYASICRSKQFEYCEFFISDLTK